MRYRTMLSLVVTVASLSASVRAADFDGKAPLVCALAELQSCIPDEGCRRESAFALDLPAILSIDVPNKAIDGRRPDGEKRTTKIDIASFNEHGLALQGIDGRRSWTASVDHQGFLTIAAVGREAGFIVFGECMLR